MSTLLNRLTLLVSFAFSALCLQAADKKPFGLMTDLIEHTGQTWQNGYASNLPVWQLEEAIEPLQYAAIRSSHPAFFLDRTGRNRRNTTNRLSRDRGR